MTTRNEALTLPHLLCSIAAQTLLPDEIVIVDGGSTDSTLDVLHDYAQRLPLKIISLPGSNISQGRNAAIRAAAGDIICATDAGVRLDPCWMEELVKHFDSENHSSIVVRPRVDVVSGFFLPDPHSVFETALAATTLPTLADIRPDKFLPSSRSIAFRKTVWEQVNGYPEWLDYCEDLIFDLALRQAGVGFTFASRAVAYFRPRPSLRAFFKQYYCYARGDGKANLWLKRHLVRYATYLLVLPITIALTFLAPLLGVTLWLFAFFAVLFTPFKRLAPMLRSLNWIDRVRAVAWVPVIRVTGDVAKMIGYPVGVAWRLRRVSR